MTFLAEPQRPGRLIGTSVDQFGHILIVDDEPELCATVRDYLSYERYQVSVAHDGDEMRRVIAQAAVDLVLLDLMLPGEDGLTLARSLRGGERDVGIIMLTGRSDAIDRIIGLEMGADDYLAKPFHQRELLARIKSVMRRRAMVRAAPPLSPGLSRTEARFAGWRLDMAARVLVAPTGEDVKLTAAEFELLVAFINHANRVLSRDQLLDLAHGREAGPLDRTIDVQVGRLRRKLAEDPQQPHLIKTVRGGGYMFAATVEMAAAQTGR